MDVSHFASGLIEHYQQTLNHFREGTLPSAALVTRTVSQARLSCWKNLLHPDFIGWAEKEAAKTPDSAGKPMDVWTYIQRDMANVLDRFSKVTATIEQQDPEALAARVPSEPAQPLQQNATATSRQVFLPDTSAAREAGLLSFRRRERSRSPRPSSSRTSVARVAPCRSPRPSPSHEDQGEKGVSDAQITEKEDKAPRQPPKGRICLHYLLLLRPSE